VNELVEHLDTLVGPKCHLYKKLHKFILLTYYDCVVGDVISDGIFTIEVKIDNPGIVSSKMLRVFKTDTSGCIWVFDDNITHDINGTTDDIGFTSLDEKCKMLARNTDSSYEPWEVN
jgi:hypothetical protein